MIPPRTILAAVNFSHASRTALALAARLAHHCGAELHVLHVENPLFDAAADRAGINLAPQTLAELTRVIADVWPAVQADWQSHVIAGQVVEVVLDVAHRHHADLIVVGSGTASYAERWLFGSTSEALLRRADVSVLVAPATWRPPHPESADLSGMGPLVAAAEADAPSDTAAGVAGALARVLGTSVEIVPPERITHALANRVASAGGSRLGGTPIVILARKTAAGRRGLVRAMASQALSAAVPILIHISDQAMWM